MNRREILRHARFLLIPVFGLLALFVLPLGFVVGLIHPPWGEGIWNGFFYFMEQVGP